MEEVSNTKLAQPEDIRFATFSSLGLRDLRALQTGLTSSNCKRVRDLGDEICFSSNDMRFFTVRQILSQTEICDFKLQLKLGIGKISS